MEAFTKRVKMLAKRALVFTIIARALAALRDWLADVVAVNGEARDAIAQLKGALLTLAQPLVQIIIPAFTALVKVLATVVSFIANIVSALFGTTAKESANAAKSLNDQMNAYKGVGSAAKSASKQLASFDEINKLSSESSGGASAILPNFSQIGKMDFLDEITDRLKKIGQDIANIFRDVKSFIGNVFSGDWGAALDNIIDFVNHADTAGRFAGLCGVYLWRDHRHHHRKVRSCRYSGGRYVDRYQGHCTGWSWPYFWHTDRRLRENETVGYPNAYRR